MKTTYSIAIALLLLIGCTARDNNIEKYSGVYNFYKYEVEYYNGDNTADSLNTVADIGKIGLYDNGSDDFNYFVYTAAAVPISWINNNCPDAICWFPDEGSGDYITIATEDYQEFVIYTVEKDGKNKYKWTYVAIENSGALKYIETLYLEKTK